MYRYKNNLSVTSLQKDALNRNRRQGKLNYCEISKGNKRKKPQEGQKKGDVPKERKGEQQTVSVPEASSNQLPLAKRCSLMA